MSSSVKGAINLMLFSVAFGGGVMHSFIVSPIAFKRLPREEFGKLQHNILPLYLIGQATAPILLGLTTPLKAKFATPVLAASAIAGALNYFLILPKCNRIKDEKKRLIVQSKQEDNVDIDVEDSEQFKDLTKQFGMYHGISTVLNLTSLITLGVYGFSLGKRIL